VPASERLAADLIDLFVTLPIAAALLFGTPYLVLLNDEPPDSHGNAYAAVGIFFLMIPLCVPLAALIYTGLAYLIMRNTPGKHLKSLAVQREGRGRASRKRLVSRCLFKWGLFVGFYLSGFAVGVAALDLSGTAFASWVLMLSLATPCLALIGVVITDRLFPLTRPDGRSLTDIVTGTEVKWRGQTVESQIS
jgi:hypothetical protein